jgi:hypothetical protein
MTVSAFLAMSSAYAGNVAEPYHLPAPLPKEAKVGTALGETEAYWCRHPLFSPTDKPDYDCTVYSPEGAVVLEGRYELVKSSERLIDGADEVRQFDAGHYHYDSSRVDEIALDTTPDALSFRANGLVDAHDMQFYFHSGQLIGLRFSHGGKLIKITPS